MADPYKDLAVLYQDIDIAVDYSKTRRSEIGTERASAPQSTWELVDLYNPLPSSDVVFVSADASPEEQLASYDRQVQATIDRQEERKRKRGYFWQHNVKPALTHLFNFEFGEAASDLFYGGQKAQVELQLQERASIIRGKQLGLIREQTKALERIYGRQKDYLASKRDLAEETYEASVGNIETKARVESHKLRAQRLNTEYAYRKSMADLEHQNLKAVAQLKAANIQYSAGVKEFRLQREILKERFALDRAAVDNKHKLLSSSYYLATMTKNMLAAKTAQAKATHALSFYTDSSSGMSEDQKTLKSSIQSLKQLNQNLAMANAVEQTQAKASMVYKEMINKLDEKRVSLAGEDASVDHKFKANLLTTDTKFAKFAADLEAKKTILNASIRNLSELRNLADQEYGERMALYDNKATLIQQNLQNNLKLAGISLKEVSAALDLRGAQYDQSFITTLSQYSETTNRLLYDEQKLSTQMTLVDLQANSDLLSGGTDFVINQYFGRDQIDIGGNPLGGNTGVSGLLDG